jgi:hypothetical protein
MIDDTRKDLIKIKGVVDDVSDLPTSGNHNGDIYYVGEYELLSTQPSDWTTNWTDYFTKSGDEFIPVTGSSAPTFATDTYYKKIDGYAEYIWIEDESDYVVTTSQPDDWTTNWKAYYVSNGQGGYTPVTGDTAPTWTTNTYYEHSGTWEELGPRTLELPDATTTQKGIVQLSNTINNDGDKAATPAAVKQAIDAAVSGGTSYNAGTGIDFETVTATSVNIRTKLNSYTATTNAINVTPVTTGLANRLYPVQVDSNGQLAVNVPWENTTPYSDTNPLPLGTATPGTSTNVARADHVHPLQTYVADAGTAEIIKTPRAIDGVSFDGSKNINHYATCTTSASASNKVATITSQTFVLETGSRVMVKFSNENTASVSTLTLNVNNTGAKPIKCNGANLNNVSILGANDIHEFVYDGTNWELVSFIPDIVTQDESGLTPAPTSTNKGKYLKANKDTGIPEWIGDPVETDDSLVIHCSA